MSNRNSFGDYNNYLKSRMSSRFYNLSLKNFNLANNTNDTTDKLNLNKISLKYAYIAIYINKNDIDSKNIIKQICLNNNNVTTTIINNEQSNAQVCYKNLGLC